MHTRQSTRIHGIALLFLGLLTTFVLARIAFLLHFGGLQSFMEASTWKAQYLGLRFDARLAAILVTPVWLLLLPSYTPTRRPNSHAKRSSWRERLAPLGLLFCLASYAALIATSVARNRIEGLWVSLFIVFFLIQRCLFHGIGLQNKAYALLWLLFGATTLLWVFLIYCIDFGAYGFLHTRLHCGLLSFIGDSPISLKVLWHNYPVVKITLASLAFLALAIWVLWRLFHTIPHLEVAPLPLWGLRLCVSAFLLFAIYGKMSKHPLRLNEAFQSPKALQAHGSLNPVLFFLGTWKKVSGGFDLPKVKTSAAVLDGRVPNGTHGVS